MRRVLLVEDDLSILLVMQRLFGRDGWIVSHSRTVAEALAQLDLKPDWIVLDLGLADGDGAEILRHVRDAGIPSRVAIISGRLDDDRLTALAPLKPDLVFHKPVSFDDLLRACGGADDAARS